MPTKRMASKEARKFDRWLRSRGWELVRFKTHLIYQHAEHGKPTCPQTPSDHRALKNQRARVERLMRGALHA